MASIDLDDLVAFKALAETYSFSAGARLIPISQSAFSRRIEKLESALETKLVERTTRRVTLTAVGRDFYRNISRIMADLDHTVLGVKGVADPIFNEVTVACVPSAVNYFASDVIRKFNKNHPPTRVKLIDSSSNEVLLTVARGDADFGVNFVGSFPRNIPCLFLCQTNILYSPPSPVIPSQTIFSKGDLDSGFIFISKSKTPLQLDVFLAL